jgi:hypothetical protein
VVEVAVVDIKPHLHGWHDKNSWVKDLALWIMQFLQLEEVAVVVTRPCPHGWHASKKTR